MVRPKKTEHLPNGKYLAIGSSEVKKERLLKGSNHSWIESRSVTKAEWRSGFGFDTGLCSRFQQLRRVPSCLKRLVGQLIAILSRAVLQQTSTWALHQYFKQNLPQQHFQSWNRIENQCRRPYRCGSQGCSFKFLLSKTYSPLSQIPNNAVVIVPTSQDSSL